MQAAKCIHDWTTQGYVFNTANDCMDTEEAQTLLHLRDVGSTAISMFADLCNVADDRFFMSPFLTHDIQAVFDGRSDISTRVCDILMKVRL